MTTGNKDLVVEAMARMFGDGDAAAVDRYLSPAYVEHSAPGADGVARLRALVANLPEGFRYEPVRALADADLVVLHGTYRGFGPDPSVAFDLFRVDRGRIVEHWDALTPLGPAANGARSRIDGPTDPHPGADTGANRRLVRRFVETVLVAGDATTVADFVRPDRYDEHGAGAAAAGPGAALRYTEVHHVVADGDFVFVRSDGELDGPVTCNDLWRVEDGRLVEHWDVVAPTRRPAG